uniref:Uncharacterized protein n=1 Tax=viral metagenome TaxID=1070528 RepID=A0A6C0M0K9_9ZZZZ
MPIIRPAGRRHATVTYTGAQLVLAARHIHTSRGEFTLTIEDVAAGVTISLRIEGGLNYTGVTSEYNAIPGTEVGCSIIANQYGPNLINILDSTTTTQYAITLNGWKEFVPTVYVYGGATPAGNVIISITEYVSGGQI